MESLVHGLCAFVFGLCIYFNDDSVEKFNRYVEKKNQKILHCFRLHFSKSLQQILEKRIGAEIFYEKLESLSKSESYARAAQKPQPKAKSPNELIFDYEFTKLFRSLEQEMAGLVKSKTHNGDASSTNVSNGPSRMPHTAEQHQEIVNQYKEVIRKQDEDITNLKKKLKDIKEKPTNDDELESLRIQLNEKCQLVDAQSKQIEDLVI